jgi:hypothetical protein
MLLLNVILINVRIFSLRYSRLDFPHVFTTQQPAPSAGQTQTRSDTEKASTFDRVESNANVRLLPTTVNTYLYLYTCSTSGVQKNVINECEHLFRSI